MTRHVAEVMRLQRGRAEEKEVDVKNAVGETRWRKTRGKKRNVVHLTGKSLETNRQRRTKKKRVSCIVEKKELLKTQKLEQSK